MPRKAAKKPTPLYLEPRTNKQYDTQRRVLDALGYARRNPKMPFSKAAKAVGTTVKTVRSYAGPALEMRAGRVAVKPTDRIARSVRMLTTESEVVVTVRNSRDATRIANHSNAVKAALYTFGYDTSALKKFEGKTIRAGGKVYTFETDFAAITRQTRAGALHFLDIYAPGAAA